MKRGRKELCTSSAQTSANWASPAYLTGYVTVRPGFDCIALPQTAGTDGSLVISPFDLILVTGERIQLAGRMVSYAREYGALQGLFNRLKSGGTLPLVSCAADCMTLQQHPNELSAHIAVVDFGCLVLWPNGGRSVLGELQKQDWLPTSFVQDVRDRARAFVLSYFCREIFPPLLEQGAAISDCEISEEHSTWMDEESCAVDVFVEFSDRPADPATRSAFKFSIDLSQTAPLLLDSAVIDY